MSVYVNSRKVSRTQPLMDWYAVKKMILDDIAKLSNKERRIISSPILRCVSEYDQYAAMYYKLHPNSFRKNMGEYHLRKGIALMKMNQRLIELYDVLIPLFLHKSKMKAKRIHRYTDHINRLIADNEKEFGKAGEELKRMDAPDELTGFHNYEVIDCIGMMQEKGYQFKRAVYFDKPYIENVKFLWKARNLERYTLSVIKQMKPTMQDSCGYDMYSDVCNALKLLTAGNSIYPQCKEDYDQRKMYFEEALRSLDIFDTKIVSSARLYGFGNKMINQWVDKLSDCRYSVTGIMQYENKRRAKMPKRAECICTVVLPNREEV